MENQTVVHTKLTTTIKADTREMTWCYVDRSSYEGICVCEYQISEEIIQNQVLRTNTQSDLSNFLTMSFTMEDVDDGGIERGTDGLSMLEGAELS